jgi:putative flippase GtrA
MTRFLNSSSKGKFTRVAHVFERRDRETKTMSASETLTIRASGSLRRQIPAFFAVGVFGYVIDALVTYTLARGFGVDAYLARLPAFAVATVVNFGLNRALTFSDSTAPLLTAFARYVMVCAAGLAVNYVVYASTILLATWAGFPTSPAMLPLFVACGSGVAMFVTFFGFRFFAFRN